MNLPFYWKEFSSVFSGVVKMSFTGWKLTLLYLEITTLKRCIECVIVIGMGLKSWEGRQCRWIYASCDGSKEMKRNDANGAPPKESSWRCVPRHHSWRSRRRLRPSFSFDFSPKKIIQSPYCQAHPIVELIKWRIGGTRVETRTLELMTWRWRGLTGHIYRYRYLSFSWVGI